MGGGSIGIFSGRKVYDPNYITAQITDASDNVWFVPIRYMIGDYFLTEINKQIYAFKMDGSRKKTSKAKNAKSFSILYYDVSHYLPISPADVVNLEQIINKNSLPKVNNKLLSVMTILSKTEKNKTKEELEEEKKTDKGEFTVHDIGQIKARLLEHKDRYKEEISELINFMASLDTDKIVTPLKRLTEFLQGDLKTVDAKYMGTIFSQITKVEDTSQKVLNPMLTAKKSWVVLFLAIGLVIAIATSGYFAWKSGAFDSITGMITPKPVSAAQGYDERTLMAKYPSAASLRAGVDSGQLDYNKLPKSVQKMVDATPSPTVKVP